MGGRAVSRDRDVRGYPGVGGVVAAKDDGPQGADVGGDDRRGRRRRFPGGRIAWSSISTVISPAPRCRVEMPQHAADLVDGGVQGEDERRG